MAIMDILVLLVRGPLRRDALAAFAPVQRQLLAVAQILQRKSELERKYLDRLEGVQMCGVPHDTMIRRVSSKQPSHGLCPCAINAVLSCRRSEGVGCVCAGGYRQADCRHTAAQGSARPPGLSRRPRRHPKVGTASRL